MTMWQMVRQWPPFNFMDSDEEDEFDRTAQSRSIEDAPRRDATQLSLPATTVPASSTAMREICEYPSQVSGVSDEEFLDQSRIC